MNACISDDALAAWVEGSLPAEQVAAMAGHLGDCTTCRVVLSELARTTEPRPHHVLQEKVGAGDGRGRAQAGRLRHRPAARGQRAAHREGMARSKKALASRPPP